MKNSKEKTLNPFSKASANISYLGWKILSHWPRKETCKRESIGDLLLLEWMHV